MKTRRRTPLFSLVFALSIASAESACTGDISYTEPFETYDSAGVRITLSHSPLWGAEPAWAISDAPVLEIGLQEGGDPYLLNRVMGATITSTGRVVVANGGDCTIRAFDQNGKAVWTSGGCGQGPEEFERILGIFRAREQLYIRRYPEASLKIFDSDGAFRGTAFPGIPDEFALGDAVGVFEDGSVLLARRRRQDVESGPYQTFTTLGRLTAQGDLDTLGVLPYLNSMRYQSGFRGAVMPAKILSLAVHGNRVYLSWPDRYEITVLRSGGETEAVIGRDWKPIPVSEEYTREEREKVLRGEAGLRGDPVILREVADAMIFTEFHPAHHGLHVDHSGHLWVLRTDPRRANPGMIPPSTFDESSSWDIFDPRGVWLGTVQTPARFVVYEVGEDYLLGMWRDQFEVEYVQVYELSRGDVG